MIGTTLFDMDSVTDWSSANCYREHITTDSYFSYGCVRVYNFSNNEVFIFHTASSGSYYDFSQYRCVYFPFKIPNSSSGIFRIILRLSTTVGGSTEYAEWAYEYCKPNQWNIAEFDLDPEFVVAKSGDVDMSRIESISLYFRTDSYSSDDEIYIDKIIAKTQQEYKQDVEPKLVLDYADDASVWTPHSGTTLTIDETHYVTNRISLKWEVTGDTSYYLKREFDQAYNLIPYSDIVIPIYIESVERLSPIDPLRVYLHRYYPSEVNSADYNYTMNVRWAKSDLKNGWNLLRFSSSDIWDFTRKRIGFNAISGISINVIYTDTYAWTLRIGEIAAYTAAAAASYLSNKKPIVVAEIDVGSEETTIDACEATTNWSGDATLSTIAHPFAPEGDHVIEVDWNDLSAPYVTQLSSCDSTTGWAGGTVDTSYYNEGSGSLLVSGTGTSLSADFYPSSPVSLDDDSAIVFDISLWENETLRSAFETLYVAVYTSSTDYYVFFIDKNTLYQTDRWQTIALQKEDAVYEYGNPSWTSLTKISFIAYYALTATGTVQYHIDDLRVVRGGDTYLSLTCSPGSMDLSMADQLVFDVYIPDLTDLWNTTSRTNDYTIALALFDGTHLSMWYLNRKAVNYVGWNTLRIDLSKEPNYTLGTLDKTAVTSIWWRFKFRKDKGIKTFYIDNLRYTTTGTYILSSRPLKNATKPVLPILVENKTRIGSSSNDIVNSTYSVGASSFEIMADNEWALKAAHLFDFNEKQARIRLGFEGLDEPDFMTIPTTEGTIESTSLSSDFTTLKFSIKDQLSFLKRSFMEEATSDSPITVSGQFLEMLLTILCSKEGDGSNGKYDTLTSGGAGIDRDRIAIHEIERLQAEWFGGKTGSLTFTGKVNNLKEWIEKQYCKPFSLKLGLNRAGQLTLRYFNNPLVQASAPRIQTGDNLIDDKASWQYNTKTVYNRVTVYYNYNSSTDEYGSSVTVTSDNVSSDDTVRELEVYVDSVTGSDANSIANNIAHNLLGKFESGYPTSEVTCLFSAIWLLPGQTIQITHPELINMHSTEKGVENMIAEITQLSFDMRSGKVKIRLALIGGATEARLYRVIAIDDLASTTWDSAGAYAKNKYLCICDDDNTLGTDEDIGHRILATPI